MGTSFPTKSDELTAEWLTTALRDNGALGDGAVTQVTCEGVGEQGQTGECFKLALEYGGDRGQAPDTLVAKVSPPHEEIRGQMHAMGLYEREVRFYEHFGADAGISVPGCFGAHIDSETGDFLLLLEDMSECRNGDFWVSNLEDTQTAVDAAAKMHARWWKSPKLAEAAWLKQHDNVDYNETLLGAVIRGVLPVAEEKFPEHLTGNLLQAARKLAEGWEGFIHHDEGDDFTLVHGDFHPKQMFFPQDGAGRFAVFDWQTAAASVPGEDLARILYMGQRSADLRDSRAALLQRYLDGLTKGGVEYDLGRVERSVQQGLMISLFITVFASATSDVAILDEAASARGVDYRERMFTDLGEVIEDFQATDVLG